MKLFSNVILIVGFAALVVGFTTLRVPPVCYGCGTWAMCTDGWAYAQQGWESCTIEYQDDEMQCVVGGAYGPCGEA